MLNGLYSVHIDRLVCHTVCHTTWHFEYLAVLVLLCVSVMSPSEIVAELLNNLKETKLKTYKSAFVQAVINSELFKHKGMHAHVHPLCYSNTRGTSLVPHTHLQSSACYLCTHSYFVISFSPQSLV